MAAYNSRAKRIKNALVPLLQAITYDAGSGPESAFVQVLANTAQEFDGYPSMRLLPAPTDNEKSSSRESERTVAFLARVHLPLEDTPETEAATYDKMLDLTELVLDKLDQSDYDGTLNTIDPTIGTYLMSADRGDLSVLESPVGAIFICDVNVQVRYSKAF